MRRSALHNSRVSTEDAVRLPRAGQSIEIHELGGKSSLARVQEVAADRITVAVPADAAVAVTVATDAAEHDQLELRWSDGSHAGILPVTLSARQGSAGLQLWDLTPAGAIRSEQRRRQDRTSAQASITLTVYPQHEPDSHAHPGAAATGSDTRDTDGARDARGAAPTVVGQLVDISEAALQCAVPTDGNGAVIVSGTPVDCAFTLGGNRYRLRGSVHTAWTADAEALVRVVVQFDADQPDLAQLHEHLAAG